MYSEDQLLPISALQHLLFCERQCALIHVERVWQENRLTVEGRHLHEKAHDGPTETRAGVRTTRGLHVRSLVLGLSGVADVVEFHLPNTGTLAEHPRNRSASAPAPRYSRVTPVEFKRGKPKKDDSDRVQLCAQAICLEEMLQLQIDFGELFYGTRRRRTQVDFDAQLRATTHQASARLHRMIADHETPRARRAPKCTN